MAEPRARQHHRNRVAKTFNEEITAMLEGELGDPRIALCHVTEVILTPGGKSAQILVAVEGDEAEEADTLAGLMAARGFMRHELLERMGVRHVPELNFQIDRSEKMKNRMEELLGRVAKRQKKLDASTSKDAPPPPRSTSTAK